MKNKTVIVTGGAGFIGSNLARYLTKDKNTVIVIDNLFTGYLKNIQDLIDEAVIEFIQASITDFDILKKCFKNADYVFHEAAIPSVPRSIKDPLSTNQVNINGTLNVLLAAKAAGVQKVIFASSSSVYGDTPALPKIETMNPNPLSPYAVSKLASEFYCKIFTDVFHLPVVALRYFNVYGPRQDPLSEYAAVIPRFIMNVLRNQPPVIYGDGTQTRDFTFIDDVVRANIQAAESRAIGVYNTAGGKRISINDLANIIMELSGIQDLHIIYEAVRSGDIKHSLADCSKAKESFGFNPEYDIKKGLKETIQWYQKQC